MGNKQNVCLTAKDMQFTTYVPNNNSNGFWLFDTYVPEEVLVNILSFLTPDELLKVSLVCKSWNNIVRSNAVWIEKYKRIYPKKKPKPVPWYVYYVLLGTNFFDHNLIKNGNGARMFSNWIIEKNFGDGFIIEDPPQGSPPLPLEAKADNNNKTSCFATSFGYCNKKQIIAVNQRPIYKKIIAEFKPLIVASEWTCARYDCGSYYIMKVQLGKYPRFSMNAESVKFDAWGNVPWTKIEMEISEYPDNTEMIIFEHEGQDTSYWKGHYGSKMAGAVIKILFDSISI